MMLAVLNSEFDAPAERLPACLNMTVARLLQLGKEQEPIGHLMITPVINQNNEQSKRFNLSRLRQGGERQRGHARLDLDSAGAAWRMAVLHALPGGALGDGGGLQGRDSLAANGGGKRKDEPVNLPTHREHLGQWLNEHGLVGSMVEIGVCFGGFSKIVLKNWRGAAYHMIDPWTTQDPRVYRENQEEASIYERRYEECVAIAAADPRVRIHRALSGDAVNQFQDNSLDCCYIDGNHSYEAVSQDLTDWWPKMKSGGLFCGHDYYNSKEGGNWCLVEDAVVDWMKGKNLTLIRAECSSFWIVKP